MIADLLGILAVLSTTAVPDSGAVRLGAADTTRASRRVVRSFPAIEVRAPVHDLRSTETVRVITPAALAALPIDGFAEALALQAGVVAEGGELHVRGGRSGETVVLMDGLSLNEPLRRKPMDVPILAVRSADLVTGAPEAQYGSGLAGTVDLRTAEPGERFAGQARWQSALHDRDYDRVSARVGGPLRVLGLGLVAAGDATLDGTWMPDLRSPARIPGIGLPIDWRPENRMAGYLALLPVDGSRRVAAQVLVDRQVHRPYDPAWSLDGWSNPWGDRPEFSSTRLAGSTPYRAADHLATTDERRLAARLAASTSSARRHATAALGWLRTRTVRSVGGGRGAGVPGSAQGILYGDPRYAPGLAQDPFRVIWGDDPLDRTSGGDVFSLRVDGEQATARGALLKAGIAADLEHSRLFELDATSFGKQLDSLRAYDAWAPGASAYVQARWSFMGLVANGGLRAEYFTAGSEAGTQTLPGLGHGVWSLSPRLGLAYPISVRDVFSLAYVRVQQDPGRDFLYDRRMRWALPSIVAISQRQPLGNPALVPATVISYEASVKHLFSADWAVQGSFFYRNFWGQVGTRNFEVARDVWVPMYTNDDEGAASGFEAGLLHASARGERLEVHYTWMQAWGNESRPEGDPYGPTRDARIVPITDVPLSWDRRHTLVVNASAPIGEGWSLSWSTAAGSPLPWTPKPLRAPLTDFGLVNSRRLAWTEVTNLDVRWTPRLAPWLALALEARNLFDERGERLVTVDGFPNPVVNTQYDDYGAYRTGTGNAGGAYWYEPADGSPGHWVPVNDPRLFQEPRTVRASIGVKW